MNPRLLLGRCNDKPSSTIVENVIQTGDEKEKSELIDYGILDSKTKDEVVAWSSEDDLWIEDVFSPIHTAKTERKIQCDLCSFKAPNLWQMRNHIDTHREPSYRCNFCPKVFKTKTTRFGHIKYVHPQKSSDSTEEVNSTVCPICYRKFSAIYMRQHLQLKHEPKWPCEICGKMIAPGKWYNEHLKLHQSVVCTVNGCRLEFDHHKKLKYHMEVDHKAQAVECPKCNKKYSSKVRMNMHIYRQHGYKWACIVPGCSLVTKQRCNLKSHINNHKELSEEERKLLLKSVKDMKLPQNSEES